MFGLVSLCFSQQFDHLSLVMTQGALTDEGKGKWEKYKEERGIMEYFALTQSIETSTFENNL